MKSLLSSLLAAALVSVCLTISTPVKAEEPARHYSVTILEVPVKHILKFRTAVSELIECAKGIEDYAGPGWNMWQQLEGVGITFAVSSYFYQWADYLNDQQLSQHCASEMIDGVFAYVENTSSHYSRTINSLSYDDAGGPMLERFSFWPKDMREFYAVISEIGGHFEPGDFNSTFSWAQEVGGSSDGIFHLNSFWESAAAYDERRGTWTVLSEKIGEERANALQQRFMSQVEKYQSHKYLHEPSLSFEAQ